MIPNLHGNVAVEAREIKIQISSDAPFVAEVTFDVQGIEYPGSIHGLTLRVPCQSHTVDEVIDVAYSAMNASLKSMIRRLEIRDQRSDHSDS